MKRNVLILFCKFSYGWLEFEQVLWIRFYYITVKFGSSICSAQSGSVLISISDNVISKIWEIRNMNMSNKPKYEMIENGNLKQKLMVAKIFYENYKILESYRHKIW